LRSIIVQSKIKSLSKRSKQSKTKISRLPKMKRASRCEMRDLVIKMSPCHLVDLHLELKAPPSKSSKNLVKKSNKDHRLLILKLKLSNRISNTSKLRIQSKKCNTKNISNCVMVVKDAKLKKNILK